MVTRLSLDWLNGLRPFWSHSILSVEGLILGLMDSLIKLVPEKSAAGEGGEGPAEGCAPTVAAKTTTNRRLLKMRQQVAKQNKFIQDTKKQIRVLSELAPKSVSDREELAFLKSRLDKENDLLKNLLKTLIEEQKKDASQPWEPVRLCTGPADDVCRNPWMLGTDQSGMEPRFSFDSTLSSLTSQVDLTAATKDISDRLQKELMNRDRVIAILQSRVEALTADVMKVQRDNTAILDKTPRPATRYCETDMVSRLQFYKENTDALERNLVKMGAALGAIRSELGTNVTGEPIGCSTLLSSTMESSTQSNGHPSLTTSGKNGRSSMTTASKTGDEQYVTLLKELAKKSDECKRLTDRLAKSCNCQTETPEQVELEALKSRCSELLNEQQEFKLLIREQGDQLDEYRNKYLAAQQKVEEQNIEMAKRDLTNQRVEEQINEEVARIKAKFQEKMRQLAPFPRLLEAEEKKVKELKKSNEKLLEELKKSVKETKALEIRLQSAHASQNAALEKEHNLLKVEMEQVREEIKKESKKYDQIKEQLVASQKEVEDVRAETAKIIARTKDRAQEDRAAAQAQKNALELELAKSRANAAVTIGNREAALREMQGQIGVLSSSFNDAQMQIQSLRHQLTCLQDDKYGSDSRA
ncbi:myosin motor [Culex quinquefasciatus]|uniref:Myosin motor n=1 Tax=Culex quinquefasciatus TaxID=7176 RepID=B0WPF6_CULQU|nr:myosin motor [Culex quinquefasciatus]|eukprot:XP_001850590.1 myosin motor [Culex quinquefasciatus]